MLYKILTLFVIISLTVSLSVFFVNQSFQKKIESRYKNLFNLYQKLDKELDSIVQRVPPYVLTGNSVGFVIEFENGKNFYFAGDTPLSPNLKMVGEYFSPDVVFLPIGNIYTMNPENAAFATKLMNPAYIIPTSYGVFPELEQTPDSFLEELKKYNLKTEPLVFKPGEERRVFGIKIIFLGGKNWLLESPSGTRILINPGIRYNPDFPRKYQELIQLERIDLVLITSGRFDSFTLFDTRKWGQLFDPVFIAPYELGIWLKSQLPGYQILALGGGAKIGVEEMRKFGVPEKNLEEIKIKGINLVSSTNTSSVTPGGITP